ncbi:SRR1-like protein [Contarinia nasturtii]|uniref:SRR1-like protein n=1 Tax=Contarinia nasturtii TaxID=265458 RepID=UPI0012D42D35|nr:SRR1-like protein [Contarinia nasturtii]
MTNDSNITEHSFTLVTSQRKNKKKCANKIHISKTSGEDIVDEELIIKRLYEAQSDLHLSSYYENTVNKLRTVLKRFECNEKDLICIGIGHFTECLISRHQLAFVLSIKELFNFTSIIFHEPILFRSEVNILKKLNCTIAEKNVEGKIEITNVTLVYAPHCPKQLINNLLWKNWNEAALKQLIYIGNSFSNLLNSSPSRFLSIDAGFIVKLQPNCEEIKLENNYKFNDIFNDTSLHHFSVVESLEETFWSSENKEPVYGSDNLELITIDLIEKLTI